MTSVLVLSGLLASAPVTAKSIAARLKVESPRAVAAQLFADESAWAAIEAGVGSGERQWLEVGSRLWRGCDAGVCYGLSLAFGDALAKNPAGVLAVTGEGLSARDACSTYGTLSDTPGETLQQALAAIALREKGVQAIREPKLTSQRQACLLELRALREHAPAAFK
jgi:hypothetical protein